MRDDVQRYYGQHLTGSQDLQTNACCDQAPPDHLKPLLARLHEEVVSRYYGCGLVAPAALEGRRILDLGCGSGRDVYLLSALVRRPVLVVSERLTLQRGAPCRFAPSGHAVNPSLEALFRHPCLQRSRRGETAQRYPETSALR